MQPYIKITIGWWSMLYSISVAVLGYYWFGWWGVLLVVMGSLSLVKKSS